MLNCFGCFRRKTTRNEDAGRKEVGTKKQEQAVGKTSRRSTSSTTQTTTSGGVIHNDKNNQQQDKHDAKQELMAAAKPGAQTAVPTRTPKEELVAKFLGSHGDRCDLITQYCTDDCDWSFAEAHMTVPGFLDESQKIFHSFPDFHFLIETITERPADGTVVARVRAAGTHTGAPFAFGPYPEIAATGTRVVLDPEYVVPCVRLLFFDK
jgi:hypothetical protein